MNSPGRVSGGTILALCAWIAVGCTLALIFLGGMVTTKGAGLAVPDWPLSFGSLNPPGWWDVEDVRLEHGHRLFAAGVGLLTLGLAVAVWVKERRGWVKTLAAVALAAVIAQGIMGGLRVTQRSIEWAMVHACVAQAFLCVLVGLARALEEKGRGIHRRKAGGLLAWGLVGLIFLQLILGAIMRHLGAGLAIPDFPTSFGQWIPPVESVPVAIHFAHRVGALSVAVAALALVLTVFFKHSGEGRLVVPATVLALLVSFQIALGAHIVWLKRPPITTTLHVVCGALTLAVAFFIALRMTWPVQAVAGGGATVRFTLQRPA